jgi:DNA-binding XRE family transcriptional regulator
MNNALHLLKSYRERTGVSLQDMATIIRVDVGNLSKVEHGKLQANMTVVLSYHIILNIPIEKLFKNHLPSITKECLRNALPLRDKLIENMKTPNIDHRLQLLDTIIDRLADLDTEYGE